MSAVLGRQGDVELADAAPITTGDGTSRRMPISASKSEGVPQPILAMGPKMKRPSAGGKKAAQIADDLRHVPDRIDREHDVIERAVAHAAAQPLDRHGAMDADEAADAVEREAEAELQRPGTRR